MDIVADGARLAPQNEPIGSTYEAGGDLRAARFDVRHAASLIEGELVFRCRRPIAGTAPSRRPLIGKPAGSGGRAGYFYAVSTSADPARPVLDVVVVGAGFAGLYALHKFRAAEAFGRGFRSCSRCGRHLVFQPLSGRAV